MRNHTVLKPGNGDDGLNVPIEKIREGVLVQRITSLAGFLKDQHVFPGCADHLVVFAGDFKDNGSELPKSSEVIKGEKMSRS